MNTKLHTVWQSVTDRVNRHRADRDAYRALEAELSTFRTRREVDDLLALIAQQEGPDAELVRDILIDNQRPEPQLKLAA